MGKRFTRDMVITMMFAQYQVSETYAKAKEALETAGNSDADQILKQVWDEDIDSIAQDRVVDAQVSSFDEFLIRYDNFMFSRREKLASKYKVIDSKLWREVYKATKKAWGCWTDYLMVLDYLSTCDSHIEKGEGEPELQQWKAVKRVVEEFLDTTDSIDPDSLNKLHSDVGAVWKRAKKATK